MRKKLYLFALIFFILAATFQFTNDRHLTRAGKRPSDASPFLVPAAFVRHISFGFRNVLADVYWIGLIQNFLALHQTAALYQYVDRITVLDPKFEYPYLLAIMIMPRFGLTAEAATLAERGMQAMPGNWQIPFYLGAQYQAILHDTVNARRYVDLAAGMETSPALVKRMQAVYAANVGELERARVFFATIHETAKEEETKIMAREWLERLTHLEELQKGIYMFRKQFGVFPKSVHELQDTGIVREIPADIKVLNLVIDAEGVLKITR